MKKTAINIETTINAPIKKVWEFWTKAEHIINWNFASDDWMCPNAVNDLRPNGQLNWRMEAKDGSMGFDFTGTYEEVKLNELINYKLSDDRRVKILFSTSEHGTKISQTFDAEDVNSIELQRNGWQAILENFKKYVEASN